VPTRRKTSAFRHRWYAPRRRFGQLSRSAKRSCLRDTRCDGERCCSSESQLMSSPIAPAGSAPEYRELRPCLEVCEAVDAALARGESVSLHVRMEILEMDACGQALLWIHDQSAERRGGQIARASFCVGRRIEVMLAQADRVPLEIVLAYDVLGSTRPGRYSAIAWEPDGRLVVGAGGECPPLEALLALDTRTEVSQAA
jgi:hypothetical protein